MNRKVESTTIVRTAMLLFALANQILLVIGIHPLPFAEEEVGQAVSVLLTVMAALWSWWKNNSFTQTALEADTYKNERKNSKPSREEEADSVQ